MPKEQKEWTIADFKVPGFAEALKEALGPYIAAEPSIDEVEKQVATKMVKAAKKYNNDSRRDEYGSPQKAQALVEEFVNDAMGAVGAAMYDKPWFTEVNFTGPLLALALFTFENAKVLRRTVGPMIEKYVEAGIFKYREEERFEKVMQLAVDGAGVKESHKKKCAKHLNISFDEQHWKAPYATMTAESPEMAHVKAFIKGWMAAFTERAWDVTEHGIGQGEGSSRDEKVLFTTVLFQALTDGSDPCLPSELLGAVGKVPEAPWSWVAECAETVYKEAEERAEQSKLKKQKFAEEAAKAAAEAEAAKAASA